MTTPTGPAAAALMAAGFGAAALGVLVVASEKSEHLKNALNFYDPVGPLSGKTIGAVVVWLVAWGVLHLLWRARPIRLGAAITWTMFFVLLGLLGTFPPFYRWITH